MGSLHVLLCLCIASVAAHERVNTMHEPWCQRTSLAASWEMAVFVSAVKASPVPDNQCVHLPVTYSDGGVAYAGGFGMTVTVRTEGCSGRFSDAYVYTTRDSNRIHVKFVSTVECVGDMHDDPARFAKFGNCSLVDVVIACMYDDRTECAWTTPRVQHDNIFRLTSFDRQCVHCVKTLHALCNDCREPWWRRAERWLVWSLRRLLLINRMMNWMMAMSVLAVAVCMQH